MDLKFNAEKNRQFFNNKIDTYDEVHSKYLKTKKLLADNLGENVVKILDLGAGTGLELFEVFKRFPNAEVTVVDISEKMLEELAKRPFADRIKIICGSFFDVDFGDEYDAVISTSALHHFRREDKKVLYQKIKDSLKIGGQFINSDKIALSKEDELMAIKDFTENPNKFPHMDTPLFYETERTLLKDLGFNNIEIRDTDQEDYRLIMARK